MRIPLFGLLALFTLSVGISAADDDRILSDSEWHAFFGGEVEDYDGSSPVYIRQRPYISDDDPGWLKLQQACAQPDSTPPALKDRWREYRQHGTKVMVIIASLYHDGYCVGQDRALAAKMFEYAVWRKGLHYLTGAAHEYGMFESMYIKGALDSRPLRAAIDNMFKHTGKGLDFLIDKAIENHRGTDMFSRDPNYIEELLTSAGWMNSARAQRVMAMILPDYLYPHSPLYDNYNSDSRDELLKFYYQLLADSAKIGDQISARYYRCVAYHSVDEAMLAKWQTDEDTYSFSKSNLLLYAYVQRELGLPHDREILANKRNKQFIPPVWGTPLDMYGMLLGATRDFSRFPLPECDTLKDLS